MATRHFGGVGTANSCSGGINPTKRDLESSSPSSTGYEESAVDDWQLSWIFYVEASTGTGTGTYNYSIDISAEDNAVLRWRIARYDSGCSFIDASNWSSEVSTAAIHTGSLSFSPIWGDTDKLVLEIELSASNPHMGSGTVTVRVGNGSGDTWIDEPGVGILIPIAMHHYTKNNG